MMVGQLLRLLKVNVTGTSGCTISDAKLQLTVW
jgi:hypothetical protein